MVPQSLRTLFVVHFWADILFAVPLYLAPREALGLFGWTEVDPVSARLVAAALFGIGIESLLGRNAPAEAFRAMLNLKVIWSSTATVGIVWSILQGAPAGAWLFAGIFGIFCAIWSTYRWRLGRAAA